MGGIQTAVHYKNQLRKQVSMLHWSCLTGKVLNFFALPAQVRGKLAPFESIELQGPEDLNYSRNREIYTLSYLRVRMFED